MIRAACGGADVPSHPGARGGLDARLGASLDPRKRDNCFAPVGTPEGSGPGAPGSTPPRTSGRGSARLDVEGAALAPGLSSGPNTSLDRAQGDVGIK